MSKYFLLGAKRNDIVNDNIIWIEKLSDHISSAKDCICDFALLIDNVQSCTENFGIFFNSNYYLYQFRPFIFSERHLGEIEISSLRNLFIEQGYKTPFIVSLPDDSIWENSILAYNMVNGRIEILEYDDAIIRSFSVNSILIFKDFDSFEKFDNKKNQIISSNNFLLEAYSALMSTHENNTKLYNRLVWTKSQLANHITYLDVLKKLIKEKSTLAFLFPNNRFFKMLKRQTRMKKIIKKLIMKESK